MKILHNVVTEMYNTTVGTAVTGEGTTGAVGILHSVVQPLTTRDTKSYDSDEEDKASFPIEEDDDKKES